MLTILSCDLRQLGRSRLMYIKLTILLVVVNCVHPFPRWIYASLKSAYNNFANKRSILVTSEGNGRLSYVAVVVITIH